MNLGNTKIHGKEPARKKDGGTTSKQHMILDMRHCLKAIATGSVPNLADSNKPGIGVWLVGR